MSGLDICRCGHTRAAHLIFPADDGCDSLDCGCKWFGSSNLPRRVSVSTSPEVDRLCVGCKHFVIDFGCQGYSDVTPGEAPSLSCTERVFEELDEYYLTEISFHKIIRTARTCDKFEPRAVVITVVS